MPQQRKDMTAVIQRMERDLETLKESGPTTTGDRFAPIAESQADCYTRFSDDTGENAVEIGNRIAQVLTGLMRQNGWHFARLSTESGIGSVTNVKRILQGGWKLLHVGHFCKLCIALERTPAQVMEEALKKKSRLRDNGKWDQAEDLRKTRHAKFTKKEPK